MDNARSDKPSASPATRRRRWGLRRVWAVALVTFRQGMRMWLWVLAPVAIAILVLADLWSVRFDPVFESVPAAVSTGLMVMSVLAVLVGVFFATFSMPAEVDAKIVYSVVTKPISRAEIVAGKTVGMSVLLGALLGSVGLGAYVYIIISAHGVQSMAAVRLAEARPRAVHAADLNALDAVARSGPLMTFRYRQADSGPAVGIHYADGAAPEEGGARWILGETGMRLLWNLSATPVREWTALAPGRLLLKLSVRAPPGRDAAPVRIAVRMASPEEIVSRESVPPGAAGPVREVSIDVPESGEVEIPVASARVRPVKGTLNVPAEGDVVLEVLAAKAGHLVGAAAGAVTVEGPAGQQVAVKEAPEARGAAEGRRAMVVGGARLPRETVTFRFEDVPQDILGSGDTAVEVGFSLDAWNPPLIQPAVHAVFINPATGRQKSLEFTPEPHHPTLLYLDRDFWRGGPLAVRLESVTDDNYLGFTPQSVRLKVVGGPFVAHFAAAVLCVWLFGTVIAAAGVLFSARFSWYVSILCTATFFLVCSLHDYILRLPPMALAAQKAVRACDGLWHWAGWREVVRHVVLPLPDLPSLLPAESVSFGQAMPLADLAATFGWAALSIAVLIGLGSLIFWKREVAA